MLGNITAGGEVIGNLAGSGRRYFLKDHLGSVRTTVDRNGNVVGYDDYCPFGLAMPGRSSNTANPNDNYKFTGHERDDEAGINLIYAGARYMDPVIGGRWLSIDPYAAKFPNLSPFNYSFNNPIRFMDPDGRAPVGCPPCFSPVVTPETAIRVAKAANALLYSFANSVSTEVGRGSSRDGYNFDFDAAESEMMTDAFGSETTGRAVQFGFGIVAGIRGNPKKLISDVADVAAPRTTVLGKYPKYINDANDIGGNKFDIPTEVWNNMTDAEKWTANKKFLDRAINRGDDIMLSTPFDPEKTTGYFRKEVDYLMSQGYKLNEDGTRLIFDN